MSTACARGLLLRMKSDRDFFFRVAAIEDPEERQAFLRSQGFDCTANEILDSVDALDPPPEADRKAWEEALPPRREFKCEAEWVGDSSAVVTVEGELDMAQSDKLRAALNEARRRGITDHLAVDLTECSFIDSTGLSVLVEAQELAESPLNVAVRHEQTRRVLTLTALDNVFTIHDTREDALAALELQFGAL